MDNESNPLAHLNLSIPDFLDTEEIQTRIEVSFRLETEGYVCLKQIETTYSSPQNHCLFCEECALFHLGIRLHQITTWHTLARDFLEAYPVLCICCRKTLFERKSANQCRACFDVALKETLEGRFLPTRELYHTHSHSFVSFVVEKNQLTLLQVPNSVSVGCHPSHPIQSEEPSKSDSQK